MLKYRNGAIGYSVTLLSACVSCARLNAVIGLDVTLLLITLFSTKDINNNRLSTFITALRLRYGAALRVTDSAGHLRPQNCGN